MRIAGLILAGGQGRRMGADKAFVVLAGQPLVAQVAARFAPQVEMLALSANGERSRFGDLGLPVLADADSELGAGPMAGVRMGLRWAEAEGADLLATVAVDTPLVPRNLVVRLAAAGAPAYASSAGRGHYTAALWRVADLARHDALFAAGERRMLPYLEGAAQVAFTGTPDPFANLNSPADLPALEAALRGQAE
ncbi:molybdenum cofactor guanylyltransferase [Rhodobacter sp. TJ_12]|uniref:molybdenum cofactor guanylyltransferase MobA n=1 Tax=Rhodobacter sp. TJ_12 TaxID=2029399 RepID=UPI001CC10C63|nr:molybdenum cofactor guanylyltransferase MobA [Rhodobacter sp. TJ_12]MBZ4021209.1 molybdenum cofactor guanylyltransferase [Rhodobacter sp. TJ_12]